MAGDSCQVSEFGNTTSGEVVHLISISAVGATSGCSVQICTYGAAVVACHLPERDGQLVDVALGFDSLKAYEANPIYLGVIVGRVAGRIMNGEFKVPDEDKVFQLTKNFRSQHCLHGGKQGLSFVVWTISELSANSVKLQYTSPDGADGFPGSLHVTVEYSLTAGGQSLDEIELKIAYNAQLQSQPPTVCPINLTSHVCWNLAGHNTGRKELAKHMVEIRSHQCVELDQVSLIPTGRLVHIAPESSQYLGEMRCLDQSLDPNGPAKGAGFDAYYVLGGGDNAGESTGNLPAAVVSYPPSGRIMRVYTDQPGVVFYTGNFMDPASDPSGKDGTPYGPQSGFCLETMGYPDACHHPNFPSTLLRSGEIYTQITKYVFSVLDNTV